MDPTFWHTRWREGRIGFHQDEVTPLLRQHWPALGVPTGARAFVPLAGKSRDLLWLAAQGLRVLGVELSQVAVEQFFQDNGLIPDVRRSRYGLHYTAGEIELVCGDAFALDRDILGACGAVYDRAALIALPPELRRRYASELYTALPSGCRGLMISMEYPQAQKEGPPFSVEQAEVQALFGRDWEVELLERRDILATQAAFMAEGVTSLHNVVYRLQRR